MSIHSGVRSLVELLCGHKPWSHIVDTELVCAVSSLRWIFMSEIGHQASELHSVLLLRKAEISSVLLTSKVVDAYY